MIPIYPDIEWYSSISERKGLAGRCPNASAHRCPKYFVSISLLSDQGITTKMPAALHDELLSRWQAHELWPNTDEEFTSISGGKEPNCFSRFCPEVSFEIFKLFASNVISFYNEIDRDCREKALTSEGAKPNLKDWRWSWEYVEPLHYSDCSVYSKILQEKVMPQVTIHGNIHGQVNIAGGSVTSPSLTLTVGEIIEKIDASSASVEEKREAKSKLQEFLIHPVVAAIVGGLAGTIGN